MGLRHYEVYFWNYIYACTYEQLSNIILTGFRGVMSGGGGVGVVFMLFNLKKGTILKVIEIN